ncbi:MAG: hypothetical protein U0795_02585 [Pirellulales bacterium]
MLHNPLRSCLPLAMAQLRTLGGRYGLVAWIGWLSLTAGPASAAPAELLIVVGAAGESEYGEQFGEWLQRWESLAKSADIPTTVIGRPVAQPSEAQPSESQPSEAQPTVTDRQQLQDFLARQSDSSQPADGAAAAQPSTNAASGAEPTDKHSSPLWIVLLGHGTYDGRTARFNLSGPDVSAEELASWIGKVERPLIVINAASASAPFLPALSGPNRVVVTATQSGDEQQFARFGGMLAESLTSPQADLDKDQQTSLLEGIVYASRMVARYYSEQGRLATEHALVDDNGDKLGTPLEWFEGVMATAKADKQHQLDGNLAHQWHLIASPTELRLTAEQIARRTQLEQQLTDLRRTRPDVVDIDAYYARMEPILLELARLYADTE